MARNNVFRVYKDEEALLKVYSRRLRLADRYASKRHNAKEQFIRRYENVAEDDQYTTRGHRVNVTDGIGIIDTMYSSMTAVDVEFICQVVGQGTREQALAAERGLNQAWKDTKGQQRTKGAIKDALLVDIGWVKVYYDYVQDTELRDVPYEALRAQATALRYDLGRVPTDEEIAELVDNDTLSTVEKVEVVLRDRVCIDYVPWDEIRFDPSAKRPEDIRWMAQYTKLPTEEVRQHPVWRSFVLDRYGERKGAERLNDLKGDSSILTGLEGSYDDVERLGDDEYDDDSRITVVELWDFETGLVTTFPKGSSDLVLFQRENPLMFNLDMEDRNPFKPLVVRDDPNDLEGLGDMRVIWPALEELDEYRTNLAQYVARSIPKLIGPADALTPAGKKALESQEWGEYVGLDGAHTRQDIGTMDIPALPQEAFQVPAQVKSDIKESTGASEPMRGVFPSRRTTATETEIVTSAGEQRQAERRAQLEYWYLGIARTMLQLMQLYYDRDRMLRYTDDLGQDFVWTWNKSDIALDADLDIAITPKDSPTRSERVERAFQWMNLSLALPEADRGEIMRFVGREMGLRDEEITKMVKSPEEVETEKQAEQASQQLAVAPQEHGGAPPGLSITPVS